MPKVALVGALLSLLLASRPVTSFVRRSPGRATFHSQRFAAPANDASFASPRDRFAEAIFELAKTQGFPIAEVAAGCASGAVVVSAMGGSASPTHHALAGVILGVHVATAALGAAVAAHREREVVVATVRGFLGGTVSLAGILTILSRDELDNEIEMKLPPLSTGVFSEDMDARKVSDGVVLSTSFVAKELKTARVARALEGFVQTCRDQENLVWTCSIVQDPEDRTCFSMLQKFPTVNALIAHQKTEAFEAFTKRMLPLLEKPFGFYAFKERNGEFSEPVYPFGPGGEGGRDDAIYSSPTNLDGSQVGTRLMF